MNTSQARVLQTTQQQTIEDVMQQLELLEHDLPAVQLQLLRNFNYAYLVITRNVRQQLRKGGFEHPEFLEMFDTRFAHYYVRALQQYLKNQSAPPAWQRAFAKAERKQVSPLICMALGVNAHVNNDIPQVLHEARATGRHYADYKHVNDIIRRSIDEVIDALHDSTHQLSPKRMLLKPFYKLAMNVLIRVWRYRAWRNYRKLSRQQLDIGDIERLADKLALRLSRLPT